MKKINWSHINWSDPWWANTPPTISLKTTRANKGKRKALRAIKWTMRYKRWQDCMRQWEADKDYTLSCEKEWLEELAEM